MSRALLFTLFGFGGIPKQRLPELRSEGIEWHDEGIRGSVRFRGFRCPGRRYGRRWSSMAGSLVLTKKRLVAFTFFPSFNPILDAPLDHERFGDLRFSIENKGRFCIAFDPAPFHPGWSGSIECRYATDHARALLARLRELT